MLEVLIKRHYREYELHDLTPHQRGRPLRAADYLLDERPTHLRRRSAPVDELVPGSALDAAVSTDVWSRPARATSPSSTSTCTGRTSRVARRRDEELAAMLARMPFTAGASAASPSARDDEREVGYFTFRPAGGARRGPPRARRAPDGRAAG